MKRRVRMMKAAYVATSYVAGVAWLIHGSLGIALRGFMRARELEELCWVPWVDEERDNLGYIAAHGTKG